MHSVALSAGLNFNLFVNFLKILILVDDLSQQHFFTYFLLFSTVVEAGVCRNLVNL